MAEFVTVVGHRNKPISYRIDQIQEIRDIERESKCQIRLAGVAIPVDVNHTRQELLAKIQAARQSHEEVS